MVARQTTDSTRLSKGADVTIEETRPGLDGIKPDGDILANDLRK